MEEPAIFTDIPVNVATAHFNGLSASLLQFVCGTHMLRLDLYFNRKMKNESRARARKREAPVSLPKN
jgi:hypothetical protein